MQAAVRFLSADDINVMADWRYLVACDLLLVAANDVIPGLIIVRFCTHYYIFMFLCLEHYVELQ